MKFVMGNVAVVVAVVEDAVTGGVTDVDGVVDVVDEGDLMNEVGGEGEGRERGIRVGATEVEVQDQAQAG